MHRCASQTGFEDQTSGTDKIRISDLETNINLPQPEPGQRKLELFLHLQTAEPLFTS
jgi:hypothetical protein